MFVERFGFYCILIIVKCSLGDSVSTLTLKSTSVFIFSHFSLMKRKCNFRRQAVAPEVSKNQGSFQGIFYCIAFRKIVRKYFPSLLALSFSLQKRCFFFFAKKRNAITEKFTTNSVERPFQFYFEN